MKSINLSSLLILIAGISGITLWLSATHLPEPGIAKASAIAIITIALYATARIPEYLTALLFFLVTMLLGVAPANVIFSGFQSTALWLVFGGLIIGVAITTSGLGERIARGISIHLDGSYLKLISGVSLLGLTFAFFMPAAMGRVVLLIPIAMALAKHFSFKPGSNGYIGIILAVTLGQFIPAFSILPANVPNMVLSGMAESQFGIHPLFGEYLLLHFPVLGLAKTILIIATIIYLYPDKPSVATDDHFTAAQPMSRAEGIVAATVSILLLLWFFDFIHHVSPAWVALAGAVFLLLPRVGIISKEMFSNINYAPIFFIAGVIGLGNMIEHSGLGNTLGQSLISVLPLDPATDFINFVSVAITSTLIGIVTTLPGAPAVITPLSADIAHATELPIKTVLMMQVQGFSAFPFAYQAPSIIVGLQLAGVDLKHSIKPLLIIALISYLILLPLNYGWWKLTGWL